MFIITARVRKGPILAVAAAAVVVCGVLLTAAGLGGRDTAVSGVVSPTGVKSNEDRIAYLESYGWQVSQEPSAVEELLIPESFDDSYTQYLELQSSQGFDLTEYCGKRVKRYTYEISNYPTGETGIQAGLLIYKNTVIGGDVLSPQLGGFIHGLEMPGKMRQQLKTIGTLQKMAAFAAIFCRHIEMKQATRCLLSSAVTHPVVAPESDAHSNGCREFQCLGRQRLF